jgi:hypothetical protein
VRFEHWFYTLPLGVRSIVRRRQRDREVEDRVAGGWTATKHRCGPARVRRAREQCRDAGGVNAIDSVMKDLRYAARVLRRNRAFTVVAVLTLALARRSPSLKSRAPCFLPSQRACSFAACGPCRAGIWASVRTRAPRHGRGPADRPARPVTPVRTNGPQGGPFRAL